MNSQNCSLNTSEAQSTAQYINSFLDLVENLPNEISRHLSQLHQLNNNYLKLINRTDTNVDRYKQVMTALANNRSNCSNINESKDVERSDDSTETLIEKRRNLSKKIETQLIQIQELSDEKLRYSQIIFDLIETKAKELDLDYEEVIQFNGRINNNVSESAVHRMNGNTSNKINANNSSQNVTNVGTTSSQIKEENKQKEVNEEISNNKIIDKRSLPRRACALKNGQSGETTDEIIESKVAKVPQNKTIKSKSFTKCHNFGLSMSNFYRNMARRRAKLPKGTKIHKIGAKMSDTKQKSVQTLKQNDRKSKSNRSSVKRLIAAKSVVKQTNGSNSDVHKKLIRNQSSNVYSSSSSLSSSSSSISDNDEAPNGSADSRIVGQKEKKNIKQENGRRESKRSANNNNNNSGNNKKSKANSNSFESTEQFVGEPIDPNEPTYCLCDQVSFGQMICCDNDRCTIEWFHFPCVGLEVKPKGKWYCPRCRKAPRLQNVPKRQTNSAKD